MISTSDLKHQLPGFEVSFPQRRARIPGTLLIRAGEGGLAQDSVALCYQIVVIDRQRLQRQLGTLSSSYLLALKEALKYTLELDEPNDDD